MQREEVRVTQVREELSVARGAMGEKEQLIARLRVELHDSNERSARAAAEVRDLRTRSLVLVLHSLGFWWPLHLNRLCIHVRASCRHPERCRGEHMEKVDTPSGNGRALCARPLSSRWRAHCS